MAHDDWITTAEAAALAGYHPQTIRELVTTGRVIGRKFGPVWQVSRASLRRYLAQQAKRGARRGPKPRG